VAAPRVRTTLSRRSGNEQGAATECRPYKEFAREVWIELWGTPRPANLGIDSPRVCLRRVRTLELANTGDVLAGANAALEC